MPRDGRPADRQVPQRTERQGGRQPTGLGLAGGAATLGLALAGHGLMPRALGAGGLLESFLPWLGLGIPVLALAALRRRSPLASLALMLPTVVWSAQFGVALLNDRSGAGGGGGGFRVVTHNLRVTNSDVGGSAVALLRAHPDVLALQEVNPSGRAALGAVLNPALRYHVLEGRTGLWSRYPIHDARLIMLGPGRWTVLHAVVALPTGSLAVWVAHPGRLRLGVVQPRDAQLRRLGRAVAADPIPRLLLVGDLNAAATDRALAPLQRGLRSAQAHGGSGLGFTWPASLPLVRIDHVFYRGLKVVDAEVLGRTGSDHRPVLAELR